MATYIFDSLTVFGATLVLLEVVFVMLSVPSVEGTYISKKRKRLKLTDRIYWGIHFAPSAVPAIQLDLVVRICTVSHTSMPVMQDLGPRTERESWLKSFQGQFLLSSMKIRISNSCFSGKFQGVITEPGVFLSKKLPSCYIAVCPKLRFSLHPKRKL